jgi:aryl-alcohol dehydrogenase-like predicted oxidoreductase
MIRHDLGRSGLRVSALGFGAMHLNDGRVSEADAGTLLNRVLDLGVDLIDTARGYGLSEERIGRHLAHRRQDFVLSTKIGYGVDGVPDWTYDCIVLGLERALRVLQTDWIDIVHLHSCPLPVLERGDVVQALVDARRAGKLRVAAYSGDNAEIDFALACGAFGSVQTSLSVCDQAHLADRASRAAQAGIGVIAKRPLAGAVWRFDTRPGEFAEGQYWDRFRAMGLHEADLDDRVDWGEIALRYAAFHGGAASAIVGTARLSHLERNIAAIARGPLPGEQADALRQAFVRHGDGWPGLI